ncbi:tetratricopeptide repeat protein [Sneathiella glossodoripedis]|uniref:tetratricopeptide repeat protein n=1 Tax=Sneathiella glossodoripedis TaxID=418853 RepID=UPI00131EFEA6|nr:tetratricopeptide repeat protein [Sneathiella glossodoripedis]
MRNHYIASTAGKKIITAVIGLLLLLNLTACDSPEEKAQAYYQNAMQLFEEENFEKADLEFRNALQLDPNIADAWYHLALLEEKNGKARQYAGDLLKTVELDPNHVGAQVRLAKIMLFSGRPEEAREKSDLVLRLAPENPDVWSLRAAVLLQDKQQEQALEAAQKALSLDKGHVEASLVIAVEALGKQDYQKVLDIIAMSREVHPENVPLLLTKLRVHEMQKDKQGIEETFRELIQVDPENRQFRTNLTRFYLAEGNKDKAEQEIRSIAEENPEDTNAKLDIVRYLQSVSGTEVAKSELQKLIKDQPNEYIYQLALAEMYLLERDIEGAKSILQKVITGAGTEEDGLNARIKLAELLLRESKLEEVNKLIEETIAADNRNIQALTMRAALALDEGRIEDGITDLRSALRDQPDNVRATLLLARAHEMNGAVELADDRFAAAVKLSRNAPTASLQYAQFLIRRTNFDRATKVLEQSLKGARQNRALLTSLAQVHLIQQNWTAAEEIAAYLKQIDKDNPVSDQILGRSYAGQNDLEKSMEAFKSAHENLPGGVNTLVAVVRLYVSQGKTEEALTFLNEIVAARPDNHAANLLIAQLQSSSGNEEEALKMYEKVITAAPKYESAYYALFTHHVRRQDFGAAQATLDRGLAELPANYTLMMSQAGLYELQKDYKAAISVYEDILEERPNTDVVANNLASLMSTVYDDEENLRKAYTYAKRFRSSTIAHFQDTLGWIHYKLGEYELATELLEQAVEKMPEFGTLRYHLGMSYLAESRTDKALTELEKAVEISASNPYPEMDEAKEQLEKLKTP